MIKNLIKLACPVMVAQAQQVMPEEEQPKFKTELYIEPADGTPICRILSMSGGGSKGAYEAGALHSIFDTLEAPHGEYDIISGVSVGAINSAAMALFGKGDEKKLGDFILGLWETLTNRDVWVWRGQWNPVEPIYGESGFVDDTPLYNLLMRIVNQFDNVARRKVITTANDVITGNQELFVIRPGHDDEQSPEWRASIVKASASVPFVFSPTSMKPFGQDLLLMDGGTTWNNNMVAAINECQAMDLIEFPEQIIVDVITLDPYDLEKFDKDEVEAKQKEYIAEKKAAGDEEDIYGSVMPMTLQYYYRNKAIKEYYQTIKDLFKFMQANPDINYRYLFVPQESIMPNYDILEFGIKYTANGMKWGQEEAKAVIALGPGVSFQQFIDRQSSKIDAMNLY